MNSPFKPSHAVPFEALDIKHGVWYKASEIGLSLLHIGTCGNCNLSGTCMNAQEAAAPCTPPRQSRPSRLGAAQAGPQGAFGQSNAAQHADQAPTGPQDRMQEANPYRSLGKPVRSCLNPCRFTGFSSKAPLMCFDFGKCNHRQAFASDTDLRVSAAGDALQQWQRRLSVNTDAAKGLEEEQAGPATEEQPPGTADNARGGQYEFIAQGDAQQAGAQLWSLGVVSPCRMCGCLCQPLHATVTAVFRDGRSEGYDLPLQVTHKRWRQRQRSRRLTRQRRSRALRAAKGRRPRRRSPWRKRRCLQQIKRLSPRTRCSLL